MYNYVVTAQKPTSVSHSLTGSFTSPDVINLIVAKTTRIEIFVLGAEGLKPLLEVSLYGRIASMALLRPANSKQDFLFVSTERYDTFILSYDISKGEIVTEAGGNIADRISRQTEKGQLAVVDPDSKLVCLHTHIGNIKLIPLDFSQSHTSSSSSSSTVSNSSLAHPKEMKEAFNIKIEELCIHDIAFIHASPLPHPVLAILYQDSKENRHLKTYQVLTKEKELREGPWNLFHTERSASSLIPVPAPTGGVIIVCEQSITYFHGTNTKSIAIPPTFIVAFGKIDPDGSRYLLGDHQGILYILFLKQQNKKVHDLKLERVGETSIPRSLCYLDNGVVFVGSASGDSQLIQLLSESDENGSFVQILDIFTNLGPIVDFCVVDLDRQGQGQVVTCSGTYKDGSLRIIRNGVGINELAVLELPGMSGVWALKKSNASKYDNILVVSFVGETRFLTIIGEELEETEVEGFVCSEQTLYSGTVIGDQLIQITTNGIYLVESESLKLNSSWSLPGKNINVGYSNSSQILVSVGSGTLIYLEIQGKQIVQVSQVELGHEISCINACPLPSNGSNSAASMCAVGLWTEVSVRILSLPSLQPLHTQLLGGEIIPRSLLLVNFDSIDYLLCALGDGQLLSYVLNQGQTLPHTLKRVTLGTQPILLSTFKAGHTTNVFASCDRPTVIYSSNQKLLFSNVNLKEVNCMTPLNSEYFPNSLAIATKDGLTIGTIDEIQKLHIRTIPLQEMPRRICHVDRGYCFGLLTISIPGPTSEETSYVRLIDDQTFEIIDSFKLEPQETGCSIESVVFSDDPVKYIVVGTAFSTANEDEPTRGRIIVLSVGEGRESRGLKVVGEKEMKGAVYSLESFNGKLVATANSKVAVFRWGETEDGGKELISEGSHHGHIVALYVRTKGDFILVGDLIKSVSLLLYKPIDGNIEEIARDYNSNFTTAIDILDDDTFIAAENCFNLFTLRKNSDAATDDERKKLEVVGQFHLGDFVNRFRTGSLVMKLPEMETSNIDTRLFCTSSGSIGVLACLPQKQFEFLQQVQYNLTKVIRGVGGLKHQTWRQFSNERRTLDCRNYIDGDLIENFLDLKKEKMMDVLEGKNDGVPLNVTLEELIKAIEDVTRFH